MSHLTTISSSFAGPSPSPTFYLFLSLPKNGGAFFGLVVDPYLVHPGGFPDLFFSCNAVELWAFVSILLVSLQVCGCSVPLTHPKSLFPFPPLL